MKPSSSRLGRVTCLSIAVFARDSCQTLDCIVLSLSVVSDLLQPQLKTSAHKCMEHPFCLKIHSKNAQAPGECLCSPAQEAATVSSALLVIGTNEHRHACQDMDSCHETM